MTSIAVIRSVDAIVIASDGAVCDNTGRLMYSAQKVVLALDWHCVIAQRGTSGFAEALRCRMFGCGSFEAFLAKLPREAAIVLNDFQRNYPNEDVHASLFIAGWSEEHQAFETYRFGTRPAPVPAPDGQTMQDGAPFILYPLPVAYAAPVPTLDLIKRFGIASNSDSLEGDADWAVNVVKAARHLAVSPGISEEWCGIGGFVQLTILQRNHVQSGIVHRWPDVIGEKINPDVS